MKGIGMLDELTKDQSIRLECAKIVATLGTPPESLVERASPLSEWILGSNRSRPLATAEADAMITVSCIPSTESGTHQLTQGTLPDQFDPDTGMCLGDPATPEQLAFLETAIDTLREPYRLQRDSASRQT